ncbi:MAG: flagellar basal body-associated FliL family protein [Candidatus Scalindua sp.]|nr:flagellar basal body-associated FliL family protein [Candidatus Scalindua sp.]
MFKKKIKGEKKEETLDAQNGESSPAEETQAAGSIDDRGETSGNTKNESKVGLKSTLFFAVIAMISIVCAFAFVSKMGSFSHDMSSKDPIEESTSVVKDADLSQTGEKKGDSDKNGEKEVNGSMAGEKGEKDTERGEKVSVQGNIIVPLESIVVNLGGVGSGRYLRVLINLEVENGDAQDAIKEKIVMLRDEMISFLSSKTAKEIEKEGSLLGLRLEIKNILNEVLGTGETIKKVYFSDFIIQ